MLSMHRLHALLDCRYRFPCRAQVRVNVAVGPAPSTSGREHGPAPGGGGARRGNASAGAQQQPDQRTPAGLAASYLICESDQKLAQLLHFLQVGLTVASLL